MKIIGNFDGSLADITSVVAGTGLSGGGTTGAVTLNVDLTEAAEAAIADGDYILFLDGGTSGTLAKENLADLTTLFAGQGLTADSSVLSVDASQAQITTLGTISNGTWQGDAIASAYLDSDTAHLTTDQTFTSVKTFTKGIVLDGNRSVTPGDGAMIHVDASDITDGATSASGTAAKYTHINIEAPRVLATNASVTTSDAATLYISGPPVAMTNQTITRAHTLWVDSGDVKFDGDLTVDGTIGGNLTGNVTGNTSGSSGSCTGQAATVATIAGLAPNTATTQATQPNIESIGTDGDTLSILGDILQMANTTGSKPEIKLVNNGDDASGPIISLWNERSDSGVQDGEDNDLLGTILFNGYDDGTPTAQHYAKIYSDIHDATSGEESGRLTLQVANHDGGLGSGLILEGGSANNVVDAKLGLGSASQTIVQGTLQVNGNNLNLEANASFTIDDTSIISDSSGTATLSNIDALDATTESTIESAIDTLGNLTSASSLATIGTISSGTWQGTAVATGYTKHLMHYDFQGYGTGDGTNWEISKQVSTNTAPFNHDTSIGSDGLTAQTVQTWIRTGGKVMPKACTLKRITGWSACAGSSTANIGLFKVTPVRDNSGTVSAVELADISYTALGNNKMEDHDVTSFTATAIAAGDMLFTAVKSQSAKIQYFSLTVEVEF